MNYVTEIKREAGEPTLAGRARLILGVIMMIAGLYFGLFSAERERGLGLLSVLVSPFVILTDKKRRDSSGLENPKLSVQPENSVAFRQVYLEDSKRFCN